MPVTSSSSQSLNTKDVWAGGQAGRKPARMPEQRQGCRAVHEFRGGKSGKRHGLARPQPNDLVVELLPHDLVVECSVERKLAAFATVLRVRLACALRTVHAPIIQPPYARAPSVETPQQALCCYAAKQSRQRA